MKYLLYILLPFLLLASCQQEELLNSDTAKGYLSLEDMSIVTNNVNSIQTKAVDERFVVEIWQSGSLYENHKYAPGTVPGKIELPVGAYTLKVYTPNYETQETTFAEGKLGEAVYYKEQEFAIAEGEVNYLKVTVPMINLGVCLKENLPDYFHNYKFTATIGGRTVEIPLDGIGYFPMPEDGESLSFTLQVTNGDGETFTVERTCSDLTLQPGTIYEVSCSLETAAQTQSISFDISNLY